jgi:hypothetical protein
MRLAEVVLVGEMKTKLFDQFLAEECTVSVRDLLRTALEEGLSGAGPRMKRFEFNRFEVTLDIDGGYVLIEDVLDATDAGSQRISLADVSSAMIPMVR